uniref:Large ribosomal subunit protein uL4c n=1 Tax=Cyanidium sp. THAL103 TaxID=3027999 RepID=A0A9Y1I4A0_9RHOD|nr:ribosomal protein L4 [Cyanidium sp. THAL103]
MAINEILSCPCVNLDTNDKTSRTINLKISKNSRYLIHRAFISRQGSFTFRTASSKTKSEIRGGGRKPWKQKGTGRARAGSIRSPLWRGGGVVFGPKPKSKFIKINKKEFKLALRTAIYNASSKIILISNLLDKMKDISKTKSMINLFVQLNLNFSDYILIIVEHKLNNIILSCRNLYNVKILDFKHLNIKDILKSQLIIMSEASLKLIEERYNV